MLEVDVWSIKKVGTGEQTGTKDEFKGGGANETVDFFNFKLTNNNIFLSSRSRANLSRISLQGSIDPLISVGPARRVSV